MKAKDQAYKIFVGANRYLLEVFEIDIQRAMEYACKYFSIFDTTILSKSEKQIVFKGFINTEGSKKEFVYKVKLSSK